MKALENGTTAPVQSPLPFCRGNDQAYFDDDTQEKRSPLPNTHQTQTHMHTPQNSVYKVKHIIFL